MSKVLLAIVEHVREDRAAAREVIELTADNAELVPDVVADKLTKPGAAPWRNGWQIARPGEIVRVSFERCHADEVERVIAAVTI